MRRLRDMLHEIRIWWAMECAMNAVGFSHSRRLWRRHARLIAQRSPEQIRRMEEKMGLSERAK